MSNSVQSDRISNMFNSINFENMVVDDWEYTVYVYSHMKNLSALMI